MLESLVPSRIRRTLLEYLLLHPDGRFYLRGLAKELNLPISPLRRELLRLEQLGVLSAYEEANARFYTINQSHPQFVQLKQAAMVAAPAGVAMNPMSAASSAPSLLTQPEPIVAATTLSHQKVERIQRALASRSPWRRTMAIVSFSALMVAVFGVSLYLVIHDSSTTRLMPASGEMRSTRWRLVPGHMGGFSSTTPTAQQNH